MDVIEYRFEELLSGSSHSVTSEGRHKVGGEQVRCVSMTDCRCRSVELAWWHIRLLYVLICLLVVVYASSVTWLLTTRVLDPDCAIHDQGHGPSDDQTGALDRLIPGNSLRVRRSQPRRRSPPAFYRDSINVDSGNTVDSDEWIWMSTYSKIPVSIQWLKCKIRGGGTLHCGWGVKAGMVRVWVALAGKTV